jgi:hypothetical protein
MERVRIEFPILCHVMPTQAGTQSFRAFWFPACAGMTTVAASVFKPGSNCEHAPKVISVELDKDDLWPIGSVR